MNKYLSCAAACFFSTLLLAHQKSDQGENTSVIVTAEPKHGKTIPPLLPEDVTVQQGREKRPVISIEPVSASNLQLLLLIDESSASSFDTEIPVLKSFIMSLPANAEVAVGYMQNGMAQMSSPFTLDHAAAATTIHLALGPGGGDVSPYDSLTDAVKKWPKNGAPRREVVMISNGDEGLGGGPAPENQYVNAGIESAQKEGVIVYTIYNPSAGHAGHSFFRATWGQNFLSQLSDETGGEFYGIGYGSPVSFQPFLNAILEGLQHQYRLTFSARAESKAGLQDVRIRVIEKDASLAAPSKVYVRACL